MKANGQMKRPSAPFLLSYGAVTLTDESSDLLLVGHKLAVDNRTVAHKVARIRMKPVWATHKSPAGDLVRDLTDGH